MYHLARVLQEDLTGSGECDLTPGPVEQRYAKLFLELGDRHRQCRLHDVNPLGGPGEAQFGGHGDEVFEVTQLHPTILCWIATGNHRIRSLDAMSLSAFPGVVPSKETAPCGGGHRPTGGVGHPHRHGRDADVYTATVSVTERPYASAQSTRSFYRVPVSMWNYQPRALTLPARINGPGPGADFRTAYRQALSADSPVYTLVRGFLTTYLTATTGLDRYVLADSGLAPVGGYQSAAVSMLSADRPVPQNPAPGTQVHVLATVAAQTAQFATVTLVYPLTVEDSGGTWMVAGIDLAPAIGS